MFNYFFGGLDQSLGHRLTRSPSSR